ncbi:MAG: hypothetical protein U9R60_11740, partial [Bacteroidota bacterium]|nr:hypothetical protein [Bacteroidota bacterium]
STFSDSAAPVIQLTEFPGSFAWNPQLNPDRDLIAFSSNYGVEPQIYHMKRDGSEIKKVTTLPNISYNNQGIGFCWSPDGEKILYANYDKIFRINRNGTGLVLVSTISAGKNFRNVDWNGHTNKIVAQVTTQQIFNSEFYIMDWDGTNAQLFLEDWPGRMDNPRFYIDGSKVLFTWDESGYNSVDGRMLDSRIYTLTTDYADTTNLSEGKADGTNDLQARWSPDGAWIIFMNQSNTGLGPKNIWVMDNEGSRRRLIIEDAELPFWGETDN